MTKEEREHDHIKEIAENYVNESWGSYLDLNEVDLVMAGIGVAKIISKEKEKRIAELEDKLAEETAQRIYNFNKSIEWKEKHRELEQKLEQTEKDLADYQFNYPTIKELQKENAELKAEWQEQVQKANDEGYARTLQTIQLTKAKELLKDLLDVAKFYNKYRDRGAIMDITPIYDAEQFLNSEVEK